MTPAHAGGGDIAQQVIPQAQHVAQPIPVHEEASHGLLHWLVEIVPGGEWTVLGVFLFGASGILWHRFHKPIENFVWAIVKKKMDERKKNAP